MAHFTPFTLSSLDHSLVPTYTLHFLGFRASDRELCVAQLQDGIDRLLAHLPFLGGEIVPDTEAGARPGQLRVQPGNAWDIVPLLTIKRVPDAILPPVVSAGAVASTDKTVANLGDDFAPLPRTLPPAQPRPVVRFQATIVADGVVLSVMSCHHVFDGTGSGNLYELLSDCCRGEVPQSITMAEELALRQHITTTAIADPSPTHHQLADIKEVYLTADEEEKKQDMAAFFSPDLLYRSFVFNASKIARLREACICALPEDADSFLSDNDVLTGLLGTGIARAREAAGVGASFPSRSLMFAINLRKRLANVPTYYLGNAVSTVRVYTRSLDQENSGGLEDTLLSESGINATRLHEIANVALQSRRGIQLRNEDAWLRSCMSFLAARSNWGRSNIRFADVVLSSWRHLNTYRLDFGPGLGRIDSFEARQGLVDGSTTIMPEMNLADKKAPWDVRISLRPGPMECLEQDPLISWCLKE